MLRTYARVVAIVLLALAVAGTFSLSWTAGSVLYHAVVGVMFAYVGYVQKDARITRQVVGGLGVLLLVVKGITILAPLLWDGHLLHGPIEITCLLLGTASILAAAFLPNGAPSSRP